MEEQNIEVIMENEAWNSLHAMQFSIKFCFDSCLKIFSMDIDTDVSILCLAKTDAQNITIESDLYSEKDFITIHSLAQSLPEITPKTRLLSNNPKHHEREAKALRNQLYKNAIIQICNSFNFNEEKKTYVAGAIESDKFQLYPIISIKKSEFNKFYQLSTDKYRTFNFDTSFLHSCIEVILAKINSISINDEGDYPFSWSEEEVHGKAARRFISRLGAFAGYINSDIYNILNTISSLKYEKKENNSYILFSGKRNNFIEYKVEFETPSDFLNYRKTRKLLEITSSDNFLITDGVCVYGYGRIANDYNPASESIFTVKITGNYTFEVLHANNLMLRSEYNKISINKTRISKNFIFNTVKRIFRIDDAKTLNMYHQIISSCISSDHGTIIVFTPRASEEALRLEQDSMKVVPFFPTTDEISLITRIDGAVICDEYCKCHCIGAILDGDSVKEANSSRGSRYNSAFRYVSKIGRDSAILVVIVSDDGMVDILPHLIPLVSKEDLSKTIQEFIELNLEEDKSGRKFKKLHDKLKNYEFYLSQEDCDRINPIVVKANNDGLERVQGPCIMLLEDEFSPNLDLQEDYFFENHEYLKS